MEISSISDAQITQMSAQIQQDEAKLGSFQSVLEQAVKDNNKAEMRQACVEFESYFLQMMFKEMRKTISKDGFIPTSRAQEIFTEMLDEQYAKNSAKAGGFGLAEMMERQLSRDYSV